MLDLSRTTASCEAVAHAHIRIRSDRAWPAGAAPYGPSWGGGRVPGAADDSNSVDLCQPLGGTRRRSRARPLRQAAARRPWEAPMSGAYDPRITAYFGD